MGHHLVRSVVWRCVLFSEHLLSDCALQNLGNHLRCQYQTRITILLLYWHYCEGYSETTPRFARLKRLARSTRIPPPKIKCSQPSKVRFQNHYISQEFKMGKHPHGKQRTGVWKIMFLLNWVVLRLRLSPIISFIVVFIQGFPNGLWYSPMDW